MTPAPRCYAVRRVNPFRGVTEVLELGIGRAVSTDGYNWEIQLALERPGGGGSVHRRREERQFYRYGVWSPGDGLARFPQNPAFDPSMLRESAATLIAAVEAQRPALPFPLADRFELWLMDASGETPVALLDTVARRHLASRRPAAAWTAAPAQETPFRSRAPRSPGDAVLPPGDDLSRVQNLIARRAGSSPRSHWFERGTESATEADDDGPPRTFRRPADADFPELPLTERWDRPEHAALVGDYLEWLAARLLTLPLTPSTRARMEQAAAADAATVDRLFRLYPAIADAALITRVRVRARLDRAARGA